jgi:hypothetical protein
MISEVSVLVLVLGSVDSGPVVRQNIVVSRVAEEAVDLSLHTK